MNRESSSLSPPTTVFELIENRVRVGEGGCRVAFKREWLSGRASPCQGESRGFDPRLPLHPRSSVTHYQASTCKRRRRQVVRHGSAKAAPAVRIRSSPPELPVNVIDPITFFLCLSVCRLCSSGYALCASNTATPSRLSSSNALIWARLTA